MRKIFQWALFSVTMMTSVPMLAATPADFYVELLRRGASEVEAGRYEAAVTPLRIAAFGLIDSIEHYQTAQAYLVVAFDRLNQPEDARHAASRIVAAERIERTFATLRLPDGIRTAFNASAKKFLPAAEVASLTAPRTVVTTPPQTSAKVPQPPAQTEPAKKPPVDEPKPAAPATNTTTTTPKPAQPTPKPAQVQAQQTQSPAPKPAQTQSQQTQTPTPKPAQVQSQQTQSPAPKPAQVQSQQAQSPAPKPAQVQSQPAAPKPVLDVSARLAAGERALVAANLAEARKIYRELLDAGGHDHATWIRIAEGLYRSRDFQGALAAFQRVGTLRSGEEAYRYYVAVAYYETGKYDDAKRELAAALPYIEITPDVQRYKSRIEGAR